MFEQATTHDILAPAQNKIACVCLGDESRPLAILTSGIGCGPVFFEAVTRELVRDHRVVYWDFRGHGQSDPAPAGEGYRIADHARDLEAVVQAFSSGRRPLMVGFSMGVQVQAEWARSHSDVASAFVFLLGVPRNPLRRTVVFRTPAARATEHLARLSRPLLRLAQPAWKACLRTRLTYTLARSAGVVLPSCPEEKFQDFVRYATAVPLDAYLRCTAGLLEHDATDVCLNLLQPVLFMAADRDVFIDQAECRALAQRMRHARFEPIESGSHAGSIEQGERVAGSIRGFLSDLAQQAA